MVPMNAFLARAIFAAVAVSAVAGLGMIVVLLQGDPSYLIQPKNRAGVSIGVPAPVSFASRVVCAMVLTVGLFLVGRRAISDAGVELRLPVLIGYVLFLLDAAVRACNGPVFPAFLASAWLVLLLVVIVYSDAISDLFRSRGPAPAWALWELCLIALAARLLWPR